MKTGIISILLALILALIPYLLVVAQDDSGIITITMTGVEEVSITLSPTSWSPGEGSTISPDKPYFTDTTWFTLAVAGNCNVNTYIVGEDAECAEDSTYKWTLSSNGENAKGVYALWFRVSEESSDVIITKTVSEFCPPYGKGSSLAPGDAIQFGLKLLTPKPDFHKVEGDVGYFLVGDAKMQTHITMSAVAT